MSRKPSKLRQSHMPCNEGAHVKPLQDISAPCLPQQATRDHSKHSLPRMFKDKAHVAFSCLLSGRIARPMPQESLLK